MAFTKKYNESVKAFRKHLNKTNKLEYGIAFQDNPERNGYYTGEALRRNYPRKAYADECGASKFAYILNDIVIKRYLKDGWVGKGNQIADEVAFFEAHKNDEWADCICPIFRYGLHRGDKVESTSKNYLDECYIVAQRAVEVGSMSSMCSQAEYLNNKYGFTGEDAKTRYEKMRKFAEHFDMWDVMHNGGNAGIIFDYHKNCYKAVSIDYAL